MLDYSPHLSIESDVVSRWKTNKPSFERLTCPTFRRIATPHVASLEESVWVSDPNFVPLLNLQIPSVESASLRDIAALLEDYPAELSTFRHYLFKQINKIRDKRLQSPTFGEDVAALEAEIEDDLKRLRSDLNKAKLKHYVEASGGVAAAFSLAVYCLVHNDSHSWQIIGPGGFAYALSSKSPITSSQK